MSAGQVTAKGTFTGAAHVGTLENGGISIAPFHNLDARVSPKVKADLEQIKTDIIIHSSPSNKMPAPGFPSAGIDKIRTSHLAEGIQCRP